MRIKLRSRPDPSGRSRGCAQLDRHMPEYREYLSERGNAAGYVRNCEAAAVHLSMWMKQANKLTHVQLIELPLDGKPAQGISLPQRARVGPGQNLL